MTKSRSRCTLKPSNCISEHKKEKAKKNELISQGIKSWNNPLTISFLWSPNLLIQSRFQQRKPANTDKAGEIILRMKNDFEVFSLSSVKPKYRKNYKFVYNEFKI